MTTSSYAQKMMNRPYSFEGQQTTENLGDLFQNKPALKNYIDIYYEYDLADAENRSPNLTEEQRQFAKSYDRYLRTYLANQEAVDKAKAEVSTTEAFEADYYYPRREYEEGPFSTFRKYVADPASDLFEAGKYYTAKALQGRQLEQYNNLTITQRNEAEVDDLARRGINPNKYYSFRFSNLPTDQRLSDSLESLIEDLEGKRLTGSDEAERRQTLQGLRLQQQKLNRENLLGNLAPGPMVSRFFQPISMTPSEGKFFLKDISPNAEVRYIDPKDPTRGLAVRDENTNGMFEPLDPQFGTAFLSNELINLLGQEASTILLEVGGLKGLDKVFRPALENSSIVQKFYRGSGNVGVAGLSAGIGRFAQLTLGKKLGYNNITFERAYDDAFDSALWAAGGTAVIGSTLSVLSRVWNLVAGETVPANMLLEISRKIGDAKKVGTGEEFSTEELKKRLEEVTGNLYSPSAGELTSDAELNALMMSLLVELGNDTKGVQAYKALLQNDAEIATDFWDFLTKNDESWEGVDFASFRKYLNIEQQKSLEAEKLLLSQEEEALRKGLDEELRTLTTVDGDASKIAERVLERSQQGGFIDPRSSPTVLAEYDEKYNLATETVKEELEKLSNEIPAYAGMNKNQAFARFEEFLFPAFRKIFGAIDEGETAEIMRSLGDVEASRIIKDMIPMQDGTSMIKQLMGQRVDDEGKLLKLGNYGLGQLIGMREALSELYIANSKPNVRKTVNELRNAVSDQIDDLVLHEARYRLADEGNENPIPAVLREKVNEIINPLNTAQEALQEVRDGVERKYIKELTSRQPEDIAGFVLGSTPRQVRQLVDEMLITPDSTSRLQAVQELVLLTIRETIGEDGLEGQAKKFDKFLSENSRQLSELFGEKFDDLRSFKELQEQGLAEIEGLKKATQEFEARFDKEPTNFIRDLLMQGRINVLAGDKAKAEDFQKLISEEYPELRPVVVALTKDFLRTNFIGTKYPYGPGFREAGAIYEPGGFDLNGFITFVNSAKDLNALSNVFIPLFGEEVGKRYAKDLRILSQLIQRTKRPQIEGASTDQAKQTVRDWTSKVQFSFRMMVPPLTQTGRRLNALTDLWRTRTKRHLLEILADPTKLNELLKDRKRNITFKQYLSFLGGLATARYNVSEDRLEEEDLAEIEAVLDEN
jgi:hypothetical protein|tara:strand:+ start:7076 stop:10561 length:3486 start_codon:yes stop_codon:yes gene_type:complete